MADIEMIEILLFNVILRIRVISNRICIAGIKSFSTSTIQIYVTNLFCVTFIYLFNFSLLCPCVEVATN